MNYFSRKLRKETGIALILTLSVLAIILLLVTGFLISMRTEQIAARNFTGSILARQLAQAAVDEAVFLIKTNTPITLNSNPRDTFWVSQPGRIARRGLTPQSLLYSVNSGGGTIDINSDQSIIAANPVFSNATARAIQVNWINIGTNGGLASASNPIIGRYAYWMDDEATKVNLNYGLYRVDQFNTLGKDPKEINLRVLPGFGTVTASNIWNYAQTNGLFTAENLKLVGIGAGTYDTNRCYITVDSEAVGKTPWGAKRFNLNSDFGDWQTEIDASAPNTVNHPALTNWFGSGNRFLDKYGTHIMKQTMANMCDFRYKAYDSANNSEQCIGAQSGYLDSSADPGWKNIPMSYLGQRKFPMLNEITAEATWYWDCNQWLGTGQIYAKVWLRIELVNPYDTDYLGGGLLKTSWNKMYYRINCPSGVGACGGGWNYFYGFDNNTTDKSNEVAVASIPKNSYVTYYMNWNDGHVESVGDAVVDQLYLRLNSVRLLQKPGQDDTIRDWASGHDLISNLPTGQWGFTNWAGGPVKIRYANDTCTGGSCFGCMPSYDATYCQGIAKNDPRVRTFTQYNPPASPAWSRVGYDGYPAVTSDLSTRPDNTVVSYTGGTGIANIPNDPIATNYTGAIAPRLTNHPSFYIKAWTNTSPYESVGELGYVHTGLQWRTLMLQPRPSSEATANLIPDWAVLDLFATTNLGVNGRININGVITNLAGGTMARRYIPLMALVPANPAGMATNGFGPNADDIRIATNIYSFTWAPGSTWATKRTNSPCNFTTNAYDMIGELCEIDKVSTNFGASGLSGSGETNDAMHEARIRSFANLVTTRTERFNVFGLAQSLQVTPTGKTNVVGEAKCQAIVKRYQDAQGDSLYGTSDDTVTYKLVYFRYLTP